MTQEWFASWFDSRYYPVLYQHRDYTEAEDFLQVLMSELQPPTDSRMLDLACGRGRHSIFLNKMGFNVTGVDLSPESIQDAKLHSNPRLHFEVRDMRDAFELGTFDYILNLFTSFGYFADTSENLKVLSHVREALKPSGRFILDFFNSETVIKNLVAAEEKELDGIHFNIRRFVEAGSIIKEIRITDGEERSQFRERVQALSYSDFEALIDQAGLEIEQTWGDYTGAPYVPGETPRLILFCRTKKA